MRFHVVLRDAFAVVIHHPETALRVCVASGCRFALPRRRFHVVLWHAFADGLHHAEVALRVCLAFPLSLGTNPGTPLGSRTLPLNLDPLFFASLHAPTLISNNLGFLPAGEQVTAQLHIPNRQMFVGLTLYTAGITLEDGYSIFMKKWSPAAAITILL